ASRSVPAEAAMSSPGRRFASAINSFPDFTGTLGCDVKTINYRTPNDSTGASMTRREDFRLVSGRGCYTADWNLPQQLHAVFLRADRAHAEIVSLDALRALAHPGVKAVLTGDDAREAAFKSLPTSVTYPGKDGQQIRKPFHPVLATGRVRYVGEPVAMIVAD